jgi:hypothetical protein
VSSVSGLSPAVVTTPRVRGGGCWGERRRPEIEEVGVATGAAVAGGAARALPWPQVVGGWG